MVELNTIAALRLTADISGDADLRAALEQRIGSAFPEPCKVSGSERRLAWLGPRDWLVLGDVSGLWPELSAMDRVIASLAPFAQAVVPGDLLASGSSVRPGPGEAATTLFAQARAIVLGRGEDRYELLFEPQHAAYAAAYLRHQAP